MSSDMNAMLMKTLSNVFYTMATLLFIVSCSNVKESQCKVLNIDRTQEDVVCLELENFSKMEFELTPKSILGTVSAVIPIGDKWLVQTKNSLLCFDENGKFVDEVGSHGRGPGEHLDIKSVCVSGDTVVVWSTNSKFNFYVLDGNHYRFVESQASPKDLSHLIGLFYADNQFPFYLVQNVWNGTPGVKTPVLTAYDKSWNAMDSSVATIPSGGWSISSPFSSTTDAVYFGTLASDTVHVVKEGKIAPAFSYQWGRSAFPKEVQGSYSTILPYIIEHPKDFCILHQRSVISKNGDVIYAQIYAAETSMLLRYDLRTDENQIYSLKHKDGTKASIQCILNAASDYVYVVTSASDNNGNPSMYKITFD